MALRCFFFYRVNVVWGLVALCLVPEAGVVWAEASEDSQQAEETPAPHTHLHRGRPGVSRVADRVPIDEGLAQPWCEWECLTGDWWGSRPWLDDHGISFEIIYTADYFVNTRGGLNTSNTHTYRGLLDIGLTIDTEALGLWKGGTVFVDFQNIHGRDISLRHVGDLQALNNIDAPDRTQLAEYWYEQRLLDDKVRVKLGKMDANADFAYVEYGMEFINSSAGINPQIPAPQYPDPVLGIAVFVEPVEWFFLGAGVYDADGSGDHTGFDTAFHGRNDSFTIVELGFRPTFTLFGQELTGIYRVGGWYHSGTWDVFFEDDEDDEREPPTHRGNAGVYVAFDQLVFCEHPEIEGDTQGLGAFFELGWTPSSYNEISQFYGAGCQYVGLIPTRDNDVTGLGLFHAGLSGRVQALERRYSETAIELFHKFQITPSLSFKPDAQYIVNPGGDGRDALAFGLRMEAAF